MLPKRCSYEKSVRLTLIKLTTDCFVGSLVQIPCHYSVSRLVQSLVYVILLWSHLNVPLVKDRLVKIFYLSHRSVNIITLSDHIKRLLLYYVVSKSPMNLCVGFKLISEINKWRHKRRWPLQWFLIEIWSITLTHFELEPAPPLRVPEWKFLFGSIQLTNIWLVDRLHLKQNEE